jgi:UDP-N-acetylmuramate--alanine ligase
MHPELKSILETILCGSRRRVHLIGVGGSGMSGLARILLQHGHEVSGSDLKAGAEIEKLKNEGLIFFQGHSGDNVGGAALVVHSSAITSDNAERAAAAQQKIPQAKRAEALAVLAAQKKAVVVAGMHGKTTTSSMLAYVLREAGWEPAHYVGAEVPILGTNAAWAKGEYFVVEGDESDGTIAEFHPEASILLNIEEEHLDYYRDIDEIMRTFAQLIEQTSGQLVYCADDKNALLLCSHRAGAAGYGLGEGAAYQARHVQLENFSSRFQVARRGELLGEVQLNVPGLQNVSNAAGVIAMALELGVPWEKIVAAIPGFRGANRRFEVKFKNDDFMVVDDYAHHPTEIKATLAAARNSGWKRVIALFQPHRYSRTAMLREEFAGAFADADAVFLTEIYAASEAPIEGISGATIAEAVKTSGHSSVHYEPKLDRLHHLVSRAIEAGDLVLTLGAGNIHEVARRLAVELKHFEELKKLLGAEAVLVRQEPMSKHTTLRIGGPAQFWCEPSSEEELARILRYAQEHGLPVTWIGRGSNLLVRDGGIAGLCIHLGHAAFNGIEIQGDRLQAGAGVRLKAIVAEAKKHGLGGLEFMEGIPGNLGGAIRMNAGAMQGWTMEAVEEVRSIDLEGNIHIRPREEIEVHYRRVPAYEKELVLSARLKASPVPAEEISTRLKEFSSKRWTSQPAAPSAGCIFKNPGPCPAGMLIDQLGLKNTAVGKARVSDVHGNFIVNDGGATAEEVLELIERVKARAKAERGIELETEVIVLGENL